MTFLLGRLLGAALGEGGCVLALTGELGAGKTLFVKGLAAGLGVAPEAVASPTFAIANEHPRPGGGLLVHLDLYRLESAAELEAIGFRDALAPESVVAIEWADRFPSALPADRLEVSIGGEPASGPDARRVSVRAGGGRSQAQLERWRRALAREEAFRWH